MLLPHTNYSGCSLLHVEWPMQSYSSDHFTHHCIVQYLTIQVLVLLVYKKSCIWTWPYLSLLSLNIQLCCGWLLLKCSCFHCQDYQWRFCFCRLLWLWSGCSSLSFCPGIELRYLRRTHSTPLESLELRGNQTMPHMTCSCCSSYFFTGNSSQGVISPYLCSEYTYVSHVFWSLSMLCMVELWLVMLIEWIVKEK